MTEGVPLREALKLAPFQRARVVAGATGLDRLVNQVNIMEVPDILPWVKPRQLLLTTAYPLRDERAALADLVPGLAERGLAGFAIKPSRYIDQIPPVMVEAAERLAFPLIELPPEASFDEVINAVLGSILNAQALRLERSAAIHDRFTRIVLSGGGLREIAQTLAELIERPAAILDPEGTVLAASQDASRHGLGAAGRRGTLTPLGSEGLPSARRGEVSAAIFTLTAATPVVAQPIQVDGEQHGAIILPAETATLADDALVAVEQAATVAALRLVQARGIAEADRRFQAVCLEELVAGHAVDPGILHEHALTFGWDLAQPRAALVVELAALDGRPVDQRPALASVGEQTRLRQRLTEAASAALGREAIVWQRSAGVAALVAPGPRGRAALLEAAAALQAEAARRLPGSLVSVGIGRTCDDPLDLAASHREALRALAVGRRTRGPGHVSLFEDLGLDRLLAGCSNEELAAFREATLGPLLTYDTAHGSELVRTLEVFLACSGNGAKAAHVLYVHYNTVRQRLATVEQVLGQSLDDADARLSLGLALRVLRMLPRG
ncbi:MAG: PucR family transcriptional regulator ligand-binding domain-containing protein [Chloroflexi bacterium]|nr:PucR family transcriptional regulator ligand-binding domain-containing protein [Chloroflexota bacterium]